MTVMTHVPSACSAKYYGVPLDDVRIAPEREFYHRVTAALEYLLLTNAPPEQVFQMCGLTEEDLRRFYSAYPDYIKKFKAAYQAAFSFGDKKINPRLTFAAPARCRVLAY